MLPNDPVMLLSYVNTQLRDRAEDLDSFCKTENADKAALCRKLADIGYAYDAAQNRFL